MPTSQAGSRTADLPCPALCCMPAAFILEGPFKRVQQNCLSLVGPTKDSPNRQAVLSAKYPQNYPTHPPQKNQNKTPISYFYFHYWQVRSHKGKAPEGQSSSKAALPTSVTGLELKPIADCSATQLHLSLVHLKDVKTRSPFPNEREGGKNPLQGHQTRLTWPFEESR